MQEEGDAEMIEGWAYYMRTVQASTLPIQPQTLHAHGPGTHASHPTPSPDCARCRHASHLTPIPDCWAYYMSTVQARTLPIQPQFLIPYYMCTVQAHTLHFFFINLKPRVE